jgi:hypothetical protein
MRVRRVILAALMSGGIVAVAGGSASAHVHGITPLLQCSVDSPNSGANATDTTPASATNGGPISGLIPSTVGDAPLEIGDGGFDAPVGCP